MFVVKVSGIFNSSHLLSMYYYILSTLRESSRRLDKLLVGRLRVAWSTNTESSAKNYSKVSNYSPAIVMREKYMPVLLHAAFLEHRHVLFSHHYGW